MLPHTGEPHRPCPRPPARRLGELDEPVGRYPHQYVFCDLQPRSPVFTQRSPKTEPEHQIENLADSPQRWQQEVGRSSNTDRLSKLPLLERLTDTTDAQRQLRRRDQ